MTDAEKESLYKGVAGNIAAVLEGETNRIAQMATISCLLSQTFDYYFWTGFYLVDPQKPSELIVGPYQGTLGCLRIPFGKGVCGTAAQSGETQIVEDVHSFPGHIACDSRSNSEIVVPVFDGTDTLIAVFDVDSEEKGRFNNIDRQWLENILEQTFRSEKI